VLSYCEIINKLVSICILLIYVFIMLTCYSLLLGIVTSYVHTYVLLYKLKNVYIYFYSSKMDNDDDNDRISHKQENINGKYTYYELHLWLIIEIIQNTLICDQASENRAYMHKN